jgi:6-phosphogluconate dehydrogenase
MRDGHTCVVFDMGAGPEKELANEGATGASSMAELVEQLTPPRAVWVVVPSGDVTTKTIEDLASYLERGDTIIDGGNSYYRDDMARAATPFGQGIHLVDCGTSGGVWGIDRGYCLMIGGESEVVQQLEPIFSTIAPGVDSAPRTPGRPSAMVGSRSR